MTKWHNPEISKAQAQWIDEHAGHILFLSAAPIGGEIAEAAIVGRGRVDLNLPIEPTPHGGYSITFKVTDRERYHDVWHEPAPVGYMKAECSATITHVAVVEEHPRYPAVDFGPAIYVTTCSPTPVIGGQDLTCAPFDLVLWGAPL